MTKIDRALGISAVALSLVACAVAAWALRSASGMAAAVAAGPAPGDLEIAIELGQPANGEEVHGWQLRYSGFVEVQQGEGPVRVASNGAALGFELVPLVRPLVEPKVWWVQTEPLVLENGFFEGTAIVGDQDGAGVGLEFEMAVLALPSDSAQPGQQLQDLPTSLAASPVVTFRRVM